MPQAESAGPTGEFLSYLDRDLFPYLDRAEVFSDLNPRDGGDHWSLKCPNCGKRTARIPKDGWVLLCARPKGCGHVTSPIAHAAEVPFPRGKELIEAVRTLAELADRNFFESKISQEDLVWAGERDRRTCLLEAFMDFARSQFRSDTASKLRRGFETGFGLSQESVRKLDPGVYPTVNETKEILHKAGCYLLTGEDLGFFLPKWEGRIVFPWKDLLGRTVNVFGIRLAPIPEGEREFESLNWVTEERPILDTVIPFDGENVPFGLFEASRLNRKNLLLVPDPLQASLLSAWGLDDPYPVSGPAEIGEKQITVLKEYLGNAGDLVLHLAGSAGIEESVMEKTIGELSQLKREGITVRRVDPKTAEDLAPAQFIARNGISSYRELLALARSR